MSAPESRCQEIINPPGAVNIQYVFTITESDGIRFIDVTRKVINHESFELSSLYLSDQLRADLVIENYTVRIDNNPVSVYYSGPIPSQHGPDYNMYRWVIDFPTIDDIYNNLVGPGQLLTLHYRIMAEDPREIILPFHTVCYYGLNNGYFTTADTIFIPSIPTEIPTLGQWGMILLFLSTLTITTVMLIRARDPIGA